MPISPSPALVSPTRITASPTRSTAIPEYRYFGPRPLLEDGSVRSGPTILFNARLGYKLTDNVTAQVDIFNLFDSHAHQIDYYYPSRLPREAGPVDDIHFHPVEPRSARFTLRLEL